MRAPRSRSDDSLRETHQAMRELKNAGRRIRRLDGLIRGSLKPQRGQGRRAAGWLLAKAVSIVPQRWREGVEEHMPDALWQILKESKDPLQEIRRLSRENIISAQGAVKKLLTSAREEQEAVDGLRDYIGEAREKEFDAQEIQRHITEQADIPVDEEIEQLLDDQFELLTPEQREARRRVLMECLEQTANLGDKTVEVAHEACNAGVSALDQHKVQLFQFVMVQQPIAALRDAALALTDSNNAAYVSREAILKTAQASVFALTRVVDAAKLLDRFSIAAPEVQKALSDGADDVRRSVAALQGEIEKRAALLPAPLDENIIDAEVVEETPDDNTQAES